MGLCLDSVSMEMLRVGVASGFPQKKCSFCVTYGVKCVGYVNVYGGYVYTSVSVCGMCVYVCVWLCIRVFSNERAQSWTLADRAGNLLCNLGQYLNL